MGCTSGHSFHHHYCLVNSTITCTLNEPSCANPVQLEHTASIDTSASITLLTKTTPAVSTTQPNVQISVAQPGRDCLTTTHAINLLLSNLPPEAGLAYQLPGLVNNLLSVAILCNAGCEVFFTKQVAKSPLMVKPSCEGGTTPRNAFGKS